MRYKSKIDWWFYLVAIVFAAMTVAFFLLSFTAAGSGPNVVLSVVAVIFAVMFLTMILPVITSTYYELRDDSLFIRCGLLSTESIKYRCIVSLEETHNPMSSAAPSLDRIGIEYRSESVSGRGYILVSPKLKKEFIESLRAKNPLITVKRKEKRA